jgi:hypothetical protein
VRKGEYPAAAAGFEEDTHSSVRAVRGRPCRNPGQRAAAAPPQAGGGAEALACLVHNAQQAAGPLDGLSPERLSQVVSAMARTRQRRRVHGDNTLDPLAVERAAAGERVRLTPLERVAAAARIIGADGGTWQLAWRLHVSGTTAARLFEEVTGLPPGAVLVGLCVHGRREARALTPAEEAAARELVAGGAGIGEIATRLRVCWHRAREVKELIAAGEVR